MNTSKPLRRFRIDVAIVMTAIVAVCAIGTIPDAHAKITAFFSAGTTCNGAPSASFVAGGSAVKVSLCVTTTTEALCGVTAKLQTSDALNNGRFHVTSVAYAPNYPDPNSDLSFPIAITNPSATSDFGATVSQSATAAGARQLLATFDISPQANANANAVEISLAPTSSVGVSADGTCAMPIDAAIAATFKLIRHTRKATIK